MLDKFEKVYEDAKDKAVAACKVFTKSTDTYAYADSECKVKIEAADLKDLFVKGAIIITTAGMFKPVSCKEASGEVTLTYVTTDTTTATTAKLATVKSGTNE